LLAKAQRFHFRPLGIRQYQAIHMQFKAHQGPCEKSIPNRPQKASRECRLFEKRRHPETFMILCKYWVRE
ncbi:hypothetical protein KUA08_14780, partial [Komagataeibacter melomenusus]|uniref:hypothetical protein n=1 Tax=Komagataeibacter melomenusus TaxID=2766578 RepID=UPI001C2D40BF